MKMIAITQILETIFSIIFYDVILCKILSVKYI